MLLPRFVLPAIIVACILLCPAAAQTPAPNQPNPPAQRDQKGTGPSDQKGTAQTDQKKSIQGDLVGPPLPDQIAKGKIEGKAPVQPRNPIARSVPQKVDPKEYQYPDSTEFKDYRQDFNPQSLRDPRGRQDLLMVFGYNYFEPSRQIIAARRAYYREFLRNQEFNSNLAGTESDATVGANKPFGSNRRMDLSRPNRRAKTPGKPEFQPAPEDLAAANRLTDARKLDLLTRQREGSLTPDEERVYQALLSSRGIRDENQEVDPSDQLTEAQKVDLLLRMRGNKLAEEEKTKYQTFLFPDQAELGTRHPDLRSKSLPFQTAASIDSRSFVADPLAQLYQNVTATAPANFELGVGDQIIVRIWSPTMEMQEIPLELDSTGAISIPTVGRFVVRAKTLAGAELMIRQRVRQVYRNGDLSISLHELHTMPITLTGEVFAGGTYQVPAVATALNMLYSSGGPTAEGSLRKIEIRRNGRLVGTVDLYRFLLTGDTTGDIDLRAGDVIFVPGRFAHVAVRGEVLHPAIYELLPGETLKDTLRFAGGLKTSGVAQRVQISTVQPGSNRVLKDIDLGNPAKSLTSLLDGDSVEVFSVRDLLVNKVTVEGAVDQPAEYELAPGMTVADLVERARGLLSEAYPTRVDIFRYNTDSTLTRFQVNLEKALKRDPAENVPLVRWDLVRVYTREEIAWTGRREVTVRGAVLKPGIHYRSDRMTVKDVLVDAGGPLPQAFMERAALLHQRPDGSFSYDYVSLTEAIKENPKHNLLVQDRDILAVYRYDEAAFVPEHVVTIAGEVREPARYPRGDGMKLSDLLSLAGGLTPKAGDRIVIAHARTDENREPVVVSLTGPSNTPAIDPLLQDGDLVTIQGRGSFSEKPFVVTVSGFVNRPGPVILRGREVRLTEVIAAAGGLKKEAYSQGVEFTRDPALLATTEQKKISDVINQLNDLLNQSQYKRELAKSDLEKVRALASASKGSNPLASIGLAGLATSSTDTGATIPPGGASLLFGRDLVGQPRSLSDQDLQPNGNVAVNLAAALAHPGSADDLIMMDGDQITVPERPTTVQVVGAVFHPRGVLFRPGEKVSYYLDRAGGLAPDAAKDRILVIRIGGGLTPLTKVKEFEPGDVILVPTKVLAERISSHGQDVDNLFKNLTSSALLLLLGIKVIGL